MDSALYLIPVTLGDTFLEQVLPSYNHDVIVQIKHFIVENRKSAIRFLVKVDKNIDIDSLDFMELSEHTDEKQDVMAMLKPLEKGESIGVISEAGCPAVGDPGARAVEAAHKKSFKVVPLVGPNAMIMAVMSSGFNGQNFAFNGYLPVKNSERASKIKNLENRVYKENQTQLFIEAPYRNEKMFEAVLQNCRPDTKLCIASGITTSDEYIVTKTIAEWKKCQKPQINKIPAIFLLYK